MYTRKDYSIIALAESMKRTGDLRKARFERSLSGMTLELLPAGDRCPGEAIPSVSFARDLEVGSQAGGQAIVSSSVLPVAAATRPQTILEAGGATVIDLNTTNINLSLAITGDSKKSEKVEGTDGDDLIADGRGKDKLIGGDGADQFYFAGEEPFKKKTVDKVIDFDSSEGDAIVIADEVVGDLAEDPTLAVADTKKDLKQLSKDGYDLLYFEPKGDLYVDGNGDSKGFGKKSEGGMIADLPNDTILTESDVLIGV